MQHGESVEDAEGSEQDLDAMDADAESAPFIRRWLSLANLITRGEQDVQTAD